MTLNRRSVKDGYKISVTDVDGLVTNIHILEGHEIFHKATIEAISQWRFIPAYSDKGKPVSVWMTQKIHFKPPTQ